MRSTPLRARHAALTLRAIPQPQGSVWERRGHEPEVAQVSLSSPREKSTVRTRRTRIVLAIAAVLLVVALAVLLPNVLNAGPSSTQTKADLPVAAPDPTTRELLAVLHRPRMRSDALPHPPAGEDRGAYSDRTAGEAYRLARRTMPRTAGDPVYIWPRKDGACFSAGRVSSCATAGQLASRGAIVAYAGAQQERATTVIRVAGIARDGVRAIDITLADGSHASARVSDNAFLIDLARAPAQLRWITPDGGVHYVPGPLKRAAADPRRPFWRPRTG